MSSPARLPGQGKPPSSRPTPAAAAASALMSPGGLKSPEGLSRAAPMGTPREAMLPVTNSPFREWATCNLGAFGSDMNWPANASASRSILSPSYLHMREKMETDASPLNGSSRLESLLTRNLPGDNSGSPMMALNQVLFKEPGGSAQKDQGSSILLSSESSEVKGQHPKLAFSELITFELRESDNKVLTEGFGIPTPAVAAAASFRPRRQAPPTTPGIDTHANPPKAASSSGGDRSLQTRVCCCKKSKCLKLYCECFSAGVMCSTCKCVDCSNDGNHETERLQAMKNIKQRNANAFAPKIVDEKLEEVHDPKGMHARGCRCKKSHCLKKYCECFQAGVKCAENCKCEECQNLPEMDGTPSGRPDEALRLRLASSVGSDPSGDDIDGDHDASSPRRNKKPRMLDFSERYIMSTPSVQQANIHESPMHSGSQQTRSTALQMRFSSPPGSLTLPGPS